MTLSDILEVVFYLPLWPPGVSSILEWHSGSWLPIHVSDYMFKRMSVFIIVSAGVVLGIGLAGSIGTMMGAMYTPAENSVQKHLFWLVSYIITLLYVQRIETWHRHLTVAKQQP